jgi:putative flippase GtrA
MNATPQFISNTLSLQVVRYAGVGGVAATVDIGFFYLFANELRFPYLWVAPIGFLLATLVNYALSIVFVFSDQRRHSPHKELFLVYAVSLVGLLLNQGVLSIMVEVVSAGLMPAKLTATGVVFAWNYLLRKHYVFGQGGR